jgi:hypothetical protein
MLLFPPRDDGEFEVCCYILRHAYRPISKPPATLPRAARTPLSEPPEFLRTTLCKEEFNMRPLFDDFDEFDFDDYPSVARLLREQRLEESHSSKIRSHGPRHKRQFDEDDDYDDFDFDYEDNDNDDFKEYDDYDEREFDSYAGVGRNV